MSAILYELQCMSYIVKKSHRGFTYIFVHKLCDNDDNIILIYQISI